MSRSFKRPNRRNVIWNKTQGRCAHCGRLTRACDQTVDHFIPRVDGGGFDTRNLMPLCRSCNTYRSDEPVNHWTYYRYGLNGLEENVRSMRRSGELFILILTGSWYRQRLVIWILLIPVTNHFSFIFPIVPPDFLASSIDG